MLAWQAWVWLHLYFIEYCDQTRLVFSLHIKIDYCNNAVLGYFTFE